MPSYLEPATAALPTVFQCESMNHLSVTAKASECLRLLEENLFTSDGALIIRGLGVQDAAELGELCVAMGMVPIKNVGGTGVRPEVAPNHVTPASYEPNNWNMELHADQAYWPNPPQVLLFLCELPAATGGEVPFCRTRDVWESLSLQTRAKLLRHGIRYEHRYAHEKTADARWFSWQTNIAPSVLEAETCLNEQTRIYQDKYGSASAGWQWEADGGLTKWEVIPACQPHPLTGEPAYLNTLVNIHGSSLHDYPGFEDLFHGRPWPLDGALYQYTTKYGDGSEIEEAVIAEIRACQWAASRYFKYEAGDLAIFDNYLTMHGRLAFEGERKLWYMPAFWGASAERLAPSYADAGGPASASAEPGNEGAALLIASAAPAPLIPSEVPLAGRRFLAGSDAPWMPTTLPPAERLPEVVDGARLPRHTAPAALGELLGSYAVEHLIGPGGSGGALLFRRLPLLSVAGFSEALASARSVLGLEAARYEAGAGLRPSLGEHVHPASYEPSEWNMDLHSDQPFWPRPPSHLFFYCALPAAAGAQFHLACSRTLLDALDPALEARLRTEGLRYEHIYPSVQSDPRFLTWEAAFHADEPADAERAAAAHVARYHERGHAAGWEWLPSASSGGAPSLRLWEVVPAIMPHPELGFDVWMNNLTNLHSSSLHSYPGFHEYHGKPWPVPDARYQYTTKWGDASEFTEAEMSHFRQVGWQHARGFTLQQGDLLLLDNYRVMHGRLAFTGPREFWYGPAHRMCS